MTADLNYTAACWNFAMWLNSDQRKSDSVGFPLIIQVSAPLKKITSVRADPAFSKSVASQWKQLMWYYDNIHAICVVSVENVNFGPFVLSVCEKFPW